jgi:hypothetical protein
MTTSNEIRKSTTELYEPSIENSSNSWVKLSECDEFIGPK